MKVWKTYVGIGLLVAGGLLVGKVGREMMPGGPGASLNDELKRRVMARVEQAREKNSAAVERAEQELREMFREMRSNVPAFVSDMNGLWTKCKIVMNLVADAWPWQADRNRVRRMVEEKWAQHLMKPEKLEGRIKGVLDEFGRELQAERNLLLVDVGNVLREVRVEKAQAGVDVRQVYEKRFEETLKPLLAKLLETEAASLVISEAAGVVIVNLVTYVATKAGVLAAGGLSGAATFGIGLVVGLIVDWIISNYAEGKMREDITAELEKLERVIMEGDGQNNMGMVALLQGMADAVSTAEREAVMKAYAVR